MHAQERKQASETCNGVDLPTLRATIDAARRDPVTARVQFRASNFWMGGGRNRSTIQGFSAGGAENATRTAPFVLHADEPLVELGRDRSVSALEYVLHALGACTTTTLAYHGAARGIAIAAIETTIEGDIDLCGFLGVAPEMPKGYQAIRLRLLVATAAPAETIKELVAFSPVLDMLSRALPVDVTAETY